MRKAGDQVRITAQLIDAASGFHMWSETYERSLDDAFAVQDEISRAVAAQLRIELAGDAPLAREATADPEAHTLVLRGRAVYQRGTREAMAEAARLCREATLRDPGYAQAYANATPGMRGPEASTPGCSCGWGGRRSPSARRAAR